MKAKLTRASLVLVAMALVSLGAVCGGSAPNEIASPIASKLAPVAQPNSTQTSAVSDALALREHEVGGVEVELREVQRTRGDTLNVRWRYRNTTQENKVLATGLGWYTPYKLTGDTYHIDPVNQKKYLVITDAERRPVANSFCSEHEVTLGAGQTVNSWAKFPAPPPNVRTISVYIPGVMPFEQIAIGQ